MKPCPTCTATKKAQHSEKDKKDLINRLHRIEGQIRGLAKMISDDMYCDNIINQITSVKAALNSAQCLLLKKHLHSCVVSQIQEGNMTVIDELMATIEHMKR